jgi:hypothetical protein
METSFWKRLWRGRRMEYVMNDSKFTVTLYLPRYQLKFRPVRLLDWTITDVSSLNTYNVTYYTKNGITLKRNKCNYVTP